MPLRDAQKRKGGSSIFGNIINFCYPFFKNGEMAIQLTACLRRLSGYYPFSALSDYGEYQE